MLSRVTRGAFVNRRSITCAAILGGLTMFLACGSSGGGTTGTSSSSSSGEASSSNGSTSSSGSSSSSGSTSSSGASSSTSGSTTSSSSGAGGAGGAGGKGMGGKGMGGAAGGMTSSSSGVDPGDLDQDGDGWTPNQGDCCDVPGANCSDPTVVNPGAFEYPGNGVDDDCDPSTPDNVPPPDCSPQALNTPTSSDDLVKAMDLCQFTTENPPLPKKKWGVISTALLLADQATQLSAQNNVQTGVLGSYGTNVLPRKNAVMAALSSGTARAPTDPGYVHPQNGPKMGQNGNYNAGTQVTGPASYLAQHANKFPSPPACPVCSTNCDQTFDSVDLKARIRVPTNAKSFSYDLKFYSAEYPEYLCQQYNDFFVALLKSTAQGLPADGNIAFDAQKDPVSVNNGFFQVCFPVPNAPPGSCPSGTLELVGTGMGGWGNDLTDGGGTEWLTNDAPVVPGETIEIEFMIWDAGDHNVDSLILLDHFRWNLTPSSVGVHK